METRVPAEGTTMKSRQLHKVHKRNAAATTDGMVQVNEMSIKKHT